MIKPPVINRRRALQLVGAGIAAASTGQLSAAGESADVIVIGAGLAGLNAGLILAGAGASVRVLEASQRAGGRVDTADDLGVRAELGAEQIGPLYARTRDLATQLKVPLKDWEDAIAPFAYSVRGKLVAAEEWADSPLNQTTGDEREVTPDRLLLKYITQYNPLKAATDWLAPAAAPLDVSAAAWLAGLGASPEAVRLVSAGLIGDAPARISMLTILQDATRIGMEIRAVMERPDDPAMRTACVVGGSSRLTEAMVAALGDQLHFGREAVAITSDADGVEVRCADSSSYRAAFAIIAVPFPQLRRMVVQPAFTGVQAEAIANMPWVSTSQIFLRTGGVEYWDEDGFQPSLWTDGPVNLFRQVRGTDQIVAVAVGQRASELEKLAPQERGAKVAAELAQLRPALSGRLRVEKVHSWAQQPFIGGCRHSFRPGTVSRYVPAMFAPFGRLHFAGEHTRLTEIGMESALESGERAAFEIISTQPG